MIIQNVKINRLIILKNVKYCLVVLIYKLEYMDNIKSKAFIYDGCKIKPTFNYKNFIQKFIKN